MTRSLKHFSSENETLTWAIAELLATLRDDLTRMERSERRHYTSEDRTRSQLNKATCP
jgi:hypothetical protein